MMKNLLQTVWYGMIIFGMMTAFLYVTILVPKAGVHELLEGVSAPDTLSEVWEMFKHMPNLQHFGL